MTYYIFSQLVLNWFHKNGRKNLPWQKNKTLYSVWISEIMLQQTTVKTTIPYFKKFMLKYPNIKSLNKGTLNEILYLWSGLGYYNRAKNIYRTAKIIEKEHQQLFPDQFSNVIKLPGIGRSTAGAILSLSKNYFFPILDGNIKRILLRYYGIIGFIQNSKTEKKLWDIIESITPLYNTRKFNQAMMDIGSLICTPKKPKCNFCPLKKKCIAQKEKKWEDYRLKKIKKVKKIVISWFIIIQYKNHIWMDENKNKNIWKNLFSFPSFENKKTAFIWLKKNKINTKNYKKMNSFFHHFSHFTLHVHPILIILSSDFKLFKISNTGIWYNLENPQHVGLSRAIEKIFEDFNKNYKVLIKKKDI